MTLRVFTPARELLPAALAGHAVFGADGDSSILDRIFVERLSVRSVAGTPEISAAVLIDGAAAFTLPGLPSVTLNIAALASADEEDEGLTEIIATATLGSEWKMTFHDVSIALQISGELLKPPPDDPSAPRTVSISTRGSISVDHAWNVGFQGFDAVSLSRCMIGDTGVIVSADGVRINGAVNSISFSRVRIELPAGLPAPDLEITNCSIGPQGFTGDVAATWTLGFDDAAGELTGEVVGRLFGAEGPQVGLESVDLSFRENKPERFAVRGKAILPFFDPKPVNVSFSISADGEVLVALTDLGLEFEREGFLRFSLEGARFQHAAQETSISLDGQLQVTAVDNWPKFGLRGFTVFRTPANDWGVRLEGGSVQINKSIDLFSVARVDLEEIGLANGVVNCSGGVALLEGLDAGAWVKGLRVPLSGDGGLQLDGIGLRVVVPDTFEFEGSAVRKEEGNVSYFQGGIDLTIVPVELGIGATFRVGRGDCRFAFIAARVQFPSPGIQLGCLPLYLRGVNGFCGINTTPDADAFPEYIPLGMREPFGFQHVDKTRISCEQHAIGLGADIATANPRLLTLSALLMYVHPDRILAIQGSAFVLQEPAPGKKPPLKCIMVLDLREPAALLNVEANYDFIKGVLKADGVLESYHGPDPGRPRRQTSYFALGQVKPYFPVDRPIKATVLQIFKARSYFIVKPGVWAMGASIGLPKKRIGFSAASVKFDADMNGSGELFWGPEQFKGQLSLKGGVAFRLLGKGFDLGISARVLGMAPDWLVDALLKFGVRFKVIKTIKFGGKIPFRWKKRRRPRVRRILSSLRLRHAVTAKAIDVLRIDPQASPQVTDIPDVEPDFLPVLAFRFKTNDRTGFPFLQPGGGTLTHKSGDYTFEAALPGSEDPAMRGVRLRRMWIGSHESWDDDAAEEFEQSPDSAEGRVLYGAWQADQAPDGTEGATHLHLFARTPFEYSTATRVNTAQTGQAFQAYQSSGTAQADTLAGSTAALDAITAIAEAGLSEDSATVMVPVLAVEDRLRPMEELERSGRPPPFRGLQIAVHEDPGYPWSRASDSGGKCRNFLHTRPGFRGPRELIRLGTINDSDTSNARSEVMAGAFGFFPTNGDYVERGIAEVVRDKTGPYPLSYVRLYVDRGYDANAKSVSSAPLPFGAGFFKVSVAVPVRSLTIHYEGIWSYKLTSGTVASLPALTFVGASVRASGSDFWSTGTVVNPSPVQDRSTPGVLKFSKPPGGAAFTDIWFSVRAPARVLSICYELEPGASARDTPAHPLRTFVDITWPNRPQGDAPAPGDTHGDTPPGDTPPPDEPETDVTWSYPGPLALFYLDGQFPRPPVVPGYAYRLDIYTTHELIGGRMRSDRYSACWKVTQPPSDLSPYVLATFPRDAGFPHYRAHEFYVRFNRSYVHALCGADAEVHGRIRWSILKDGENIAELAFRDGDHAERTTFMQDISADRQGWGWGKAPDHELTREEKIWVEAYNKQAPEELKIDADMAIPDDMTAVYTVNPVLFRASFAALADGSDTGPGFEDPAGADGVAVADRWRIAAGSFQHRAVPELLSGEEPQPAESMVLIRELPFEAGETLTAPYRVSVWMRPDAAAPGSASGRVQLVLAAQASLRRLAFEIDLDLSQVRLIRYDENGVPVPAPVTGKAFELPVGRWTKLVATLTDDGTNLIATLAVSGEAVLGEATDIPASLAGLRAGLGASTEYAGSFDGLEIVSLSRLSALPAPAAKHQLVCRYEDRERPMYQHEFFSSRYLDLFDHLNDWDRSVRRASGTDGVARPFPEVADWIETYARLLTALRDLAAAEMRHRQNGASLEDIDSTARSLREARFDLDEDFLAVATAAGLELPVQVRRPEVTLSPDSRALLIVSPEPLDWTRLAAGSIRIAGASNPSTTADALKPKPEAKPKPNAKPKPSTATARLLFNSDFTQALLVSTVGGVDTGLMGLAFSSATTYLWEIQEYHALPPHLAWLRGWVEHRASTHTLAFEIPPASA
jgi:hypothetical protein